VDVADNGDAHGPNEADSSTRLSLRRSVIIDLVKVSDIGEFGLIARLAEVLASEGSAELAGRLAVGIGDDAAVWRTDAGAIMATTDTLVADVHFLPEHTPPRDLGWKAIAVNVSGVAAMAGTPDFALVTLAVPPDAQAEEIDELYRGLAEAGEAYGVVIAGGDVVRAPTAFVSIALAGRAELDANGEPLVLRRDAAKAGDSIGVTGCLGGANGGLRALREGAIESDAARSLVERHLRPQARLEVGRRALAAGMRCAIDVSDGLLQDLGHICEASRLGAVVWQDKVPIDPALADTFEPEETLHCALAGGEDYELLVVGDQDQIADVSRQVDLAITTIGEMVIDTEGQAKLLDESGREVELPTAGWDHLRPQERPSERGPK
jgi:thiamine-monophosphate kinase